MRLIDAHALWDKAEEMYIHIRGEKYAPVMAVPAHVINNAPTIEAEPVRHGTWIGIEYDGYADGCPVYDLWECSECNHEHKGEEDTLTDYCPNCGAKMDGGADND